MSPSLSVTRVGTVRVDVATRAAAAGAGALPTLDMSAKPGGSAQSVTSPLSRRINVMRL